MTSTEQEASHKKGIGESVWPLGRRTIFFFSKTQKKRNSPTRIKSNNKMDSSYPTVSNHLYPYLSQRSRDIVMHVSSRCICAHHCSIQIKKGSTALQTMIIPVRCFTCGKVIADLYETYLDLQREGADEEMALDALGLTRFCCRRMLLTHVDFSDTLQKFNPADHAQVMQIHDRRH